MQRQLCNGMWTTVQDESKFLGMAAERDGITVEECRGLLDAGKKLHYDDDWYANLRNEPTRRPRPAVKIVRADCGYTVPEADVMSSSRGTSCSRCYDRMSDF